MYIYIIKSGETINGIAQKFRIPPGAIFKANNINGSQKLVVGQAIIIPTMERSYRTKPNDTLMSIARENYVTIDNIIELNRQVDFGAIDPGTELRINQNYRRHGMIETNGFIQPSTPEHEQEVLQGVISTLTYVTPFSHHINPDGSLTSLDDAMIKKIAKQNKTAVMLSVTNLSGANFDTELVDKILNDPNLAKTLINNIKIMLNNGEYYGVIVDFEKISPGNREKYNLFLASLTSNLKPDYAVAVALAPKTYDVKAGAWHGAHDYKTIGSIADFVVIMTYEWGWSGGPPMAVAPINEVEKVINYAVTVIPPKKILMGMPLYGYDWTLPYVPGGAFAESIGNEEAVKRASEVNAAIKYDTKAQSPYYDYYDKQGREHQVWFEDARSTLAKYEFVIRKGLRGVSYWVLGKPFIQNFIVVDDLFSIAKKEK